MACKHQEELSLSWDNFNTHFSSGIYDFFYEGDLVDVTFAAEGQQIKVHRLVLSLCSPYFRQMLAQTPSNQDEIVSLKNISFATLKNLIQFMYCGEVSLSQDNLLEFLCLAETFEIKGLSHNEPPKDASIETITTAPQKTKGARKSKVYYDDKAAIVVQPTHKRAREQSNTEQTAPKRMKIHSMEVDSYPKQPKSFNELDDLVPINTQMLYDAEFNYVDVQHDFDFATGPGDDAADEEVPDDQIPVNDLNEHNWKQQAFADNINSLDDRTVSPAVDLFKCPHCVYTSKQKSNVTKHIRTQHTHKDEKPFKCGKCSYATKRKEHLVRHEKTCKG